MKHLITLIAFLCMLPVCCFGSDAISIHDNVIYVIQESPSNPNLLNITVNRINSNSTTQLVLRSNSMGIPSQVDKVMCDGKLLSEVKTGVWSVPANCLKLQWQVSLLNNPNELASSQQSIKSGSFILFSESSSLPRLQDASDESIKILIPNVNSVFPIKNSIGEISLPKSPSAPLFLLINPNHVVNYSSDDVGLNYYIDDKTNFYLLPEVSSHVNALKWLKRVVHHNSKENFNIAWLRLPASKFSLSGATGNEVLLTNYPVDGILPFGKTMLLYVTLHEAFHQLATNNTQQPPWVSESLASYYGVQALQFSLPGDIEVTQLKERFLSGASQFKDGLITINQKVEEGDRSEYGAFYTKGIAFWLAVNNDLKKSNDSLDNHIVDVMQANYDKNGVPTNLREILNLSPDVWSKLYHDFL